MYHNGMDVPYQATGRTHQKARTREALLAAARTLLASGRTPAVEEAAAAARVSRTTAYRYFPTQEALVLAAYPETGDAPVLGPDPPSDVGARFELVLAAMTKQLRSNEAALRAMLRISLESPADRGQLLLRKGRRRTWLADALAPLQAELNEQDFDRIVLAIASATGIEAYVWLTDIAGLTTEQALDVMHFSARTLLDAARG